MKTNRAKDASDSVRKRIEQFYAAGDVPWVKSSLSQLRHGLGRNPWNAPRAFYEALSILPERLYPDRGELTRAEWAVYTALTLFAAHQQGHDLMRERMHEHRKSLGFALLGACGGIKNEERSRGRLNHLAASNGIEELSDNLRQCISLMSSKSISIDYARLTEDIFWFQTSEGRNRVILDWGRDYYKAISKERAKDGVNDSE
jgi:CRISPR system Cascade subunit CasB